MWLKMFVAVSPHLSPRLPMRPESTTWLSALVDRYWHKPGIRHPWPGARFSVKYPGKTAAVPFLDPRKSVPSQSLAAG